MTGAVPPHALKGTERRHQALLIVKTRYKELPVWRHEFAKSVIGQHANKGSLSAKQWACVCHLAAIIKGEKPSDSTQDKKAGPPVVKVGNFEMVYDLLAGVVGKLKFPRLTFEVDGESMVLYPAGQKSAAPGVLNLVRADPNRWYGRIAKDGTWSNYARLEPDKRERVWDFINRLGKDPTGVLAERGRLAGRCCYCYRELTDEKSTATGYGPVCAKKWGLPWGKKTNILYPFDAAVAAEMEEFGA